MNIIDKIKFWSWNKKEEANERKMKKKYPTYMDESCILWDEIAVSAGARGHQMIVPPEELASLVNAELADIIQ